MRKQLISGPVAEPISLTEAKAHLRVDGTAEDIYIGALITAARVHVERITGRALCTQSWAVYPEAFPSTLLNYYGLGGRATNLPIPVVRDIRAAQCIWLPFGQLQSVDAFSYVLADGTTVTWTPSGLNLLDANSTVVGHISTTSDVGGAIVLPVNQAWPSAQLRSVDPITIEITVGYGDATDVPASLRHAIQLLVAEWYETREPAQIGTAITAVPIPHAVEALVGPYRTY